MLLRMLREFSQALNATTFDFITIFLNSDYPERGRQLYSLSISHVTRSTNCLTIQYYYLRVRLSTADLPQKHSNTSKHSVSSLILLFKKKLLSDNDIF